MLLRATAALAAILLLFTWFCGGVSARGIQPGENAASGGAVRAMRGVPPAYASFDPEREVTLIVGADGGSESLKSVKKEILAFAPDAKIMRDYTILFKGFAVTLKAGEAEKVASLAGVSKVWQSYSRPVSGGEASPVGSGEDALLAAAALNPGYAYRGEGMVAAVIDSSFNVKHEMFALSDVGLSSARLTKADIDGAVDGGLKVANYFTYGSGQGKSPYVSQKIPYAFDYSDFDTDVGDGDSHGTHVAGIIGANNVSGSAEGFDGIAPEAQLLLMKAAQDDSGQLDDYAILYAFEDAISLGADVINMSFSSPSGSAYQQYGSYDYSDAMDKAEERGIIVVCSAGNENMLGVGSNYDELYGISLPLTSNPDSGLVGSPSTFKTGFSVASVESGYIIANSYIKTSGGDIMIYSLPDAGADLSAFSNAKSPAEYVRVPGYGAEEDYKDIDVSGKVALIMRGSLTFAEKIKFAAAVGASAAVIYNNSPDGLVTMKLGEDKDARVIPAVFVSRSDGEKLAAASDRRISFVSGKKTALLSPQGGTMSTFTSRGPSSDLSLKPEIAAPGSNIYSATRTGYGLMSGTSMSSPYISGSVILVKQMLSQTGLDAKNGSLVRNILMTTASTVTDPAAKTEYSPRVQGAGRADLAAALEAEAVLSYGSGAAKAELGDGLKNSFSFEFTVTNLTDTDKRYYVGASVGSDGYEYISFDISNPFTGGEYFIDGAYSAFSRAKITLDGGSGADINKYKGKRSESVTVAAGSSLTLKINVEIDKNTFNRYSEIFKNGFFAEGYVWLTPADGGKAISLPYMGFCGDWSAAPVFDGAVNDERSGFYTQHAFSYYGAGGELYGYFLGRSLFLKEDTVNAAAVAISPDGDGYGDYLALLLNPLRNAGDFAVTIKSRDGETVLDEAELGCLVKAYYSDTSENLEGTEYGYMWDGSDLYNYLYRMPDGEYTVALYTVSDGVVSPGSAASAGVAVWTMDFIVDTEAPVLKKCGFTRGENGELYLNVEVSDNNLLQYVGPYDGAGDLGEAYTPRAADAAPAEKLSFDVTEALENGDKYIYLDIVDFALNITTEKIAFHFDAAGGNS